jgi:hypothetical protein
VHAEARRGARGADAGRVQTRAVEGGVQRRAVERAPPYCPSVESKTASATLRQPLPAARLASRLLGRAPLHLLTALCLAGLWLIVAPRSPDLAAQSYRSYLYSHFGTLVWDGNWYGGHHIPGYSLLYPPLASLLGVRTLGALAAIASAALFGRIAAVSFGPRTRLASAWFAVAVAGDLWIGRLTFALGVAFALAAALALIEGEGRRYTALAALCAALGAASSPVAGLLLALVGATDLLVHRRPRWALALVLPVLVVVLPLQLLFPEGGFEPYGLESFLPSTAVALAFVWALPARERLLRAGGLLFLLVNALCLLPTPMGSNVTRYAVLLSGPLLLCALARGDGGASSGGDRRASFGGDGCASSGGDRRASFGGDGCASSGGDGRASFGGGGVPRRFGGHAVNEGRRPTWALAAVLAGIAFWMLWGPILQSTGVLHDPSTTASYYAPLRRFLATHAKGPVRIEVPFTRSHWETALLAPHVALARGWERQLDKRYDEAIEADPLPPPVYKRWLRGNAVSYVALPDVPLDGSSLGEAALIRHGAPFLRPVLTSRHWRVYEVLGSRPLAEGPGSLLQLGHQGFTLSAWAAGSLLVRVHYTPYWQVVGGRGAVSEARSGWTRVSVRAPGLMRVQARFSLSGALKALGSI